MFYINYLCQLFSSYEENLLPVCRPIHTLFCMRKAVLKLVPNGHEKYPWRIEGYRELGKRKRLYFRSKREALTKLHQLREISSKEGLQAQHLPVQLRLDAIQASNVLKPHGVSLTEAASFYLRYNGEMKASKTVADALEEYFAERERQNLSAVSLRDAKSRLGRFSIEFGGKLLAESRHRQIQEWLHGLKGIGAQTTNNYITVLSAFFNWGVKQGYCSTNPLAKISKIKQRQDEPIAILKPEDLKKLLNASPRKMLPVFTIGAFAGVRMSELTRLDWSNIHFKKGLVEVPTSKAKTARRRFIEMQPCLKAWLAPYEGSTGRVWPYTLEYFSHEREKLASSLGLKWPQNGLRHSFASYHLAAFENVAQTSLQLGHSGSDLIFSRYRELVTKEEALKYWDILPNSK